MLAGFVREYEPAPGAAPTAAAELLAEAVQLVQNLDPVGVATRSLRECLLVQIEAQRREFQLAQARHRSTEAAVPEAVNGGRRSRSGPCLSARTKTNCPSSRLRLAL